MDSKTKAECSITPGWHRIDEGMQTMQSTVTWALQNKIKER